MTTSFYFILLFQSLCCILLATYASAAWGSTEEKKVLLKDISVLTLYSGKMTNGRRSSPVSQLECTGAGSAPCSSFKPKVVQCDNKGSDGYDIQWECRTDMDNSYRFGNIEVSCEGYDYPEDPYVLHGSCGLRYSIDYTKEGMNQNSNHDYYGNDYSSRNYDIKKSSSSMFADLIVYAVCGLLIYALYKTCVGSGQAHDERTDTSTTNDDYPSDGSGRGGGYGWFGNGGGTNRATPRYNSYRDDASCGGNRQHNATGGAGGFWTGAATGGLLGYMFGNRNNYGYGGGTAYGRNTGYGGGGGFFGGSSGGFGGSSFGGSSGTRSASGFGGTSRR